MIETKPKQQKIMSKQVILASDGQETMWESLTHSLAGQGHPSDGYCMPLSRLGFEDPFGALLGTILIDLGWKFLSNCILLQLAARIART